MDNEYVEYTVEGFKKAAEALGISEDQKEMMLSISINSLIMA